MSVPEHLNLFEHRSQVLALYSKMGSVVHVAEGDREVVIFAPEELLSREKELIVGRNEEVLEDVDEREGLSGPEDEGREDSLSLSSDSDSESDQESFTAATAPGVSFDSRSSRALHYQTNWHRWNVKLRARGESPITREAFDELVAAGSVTDESLRSTSVVSQSEEEVRNLRGSNIVDFTTSSGYVVSTWKNLVRTDPAVKRPELSTFIPAFLALPYLKKIVVFACSGGRFAGAVFNELGVATHHKALQRYTVRRKQGGSQATKDNQSGTGQPKSVGSSLRRQMAVKLQEDIVQILDAWKDEISSAHLIFMATPGSNAKLFYGFEGGLKKDDLRIRKVPFTTSRPTSGEVRKMYLRITTISVGKVDPKPLPQQTHVESVVSVPVVEQASVGVEESESEEDQVDEMMETVIRGDLAGLKLLFEAEYSRPSSSSRSLLFLACKQAHFPIVEFLLSLGDQDLSLGDIEDNLNTPLHLACSTSNKKLIDLLLKAGANPGAVNNAGKSPYVVSSKAVRKSIRLYAGEHLEQWDWQKLQIEPLTASLLDAKAEAQAEAKRRKRANQKLNKKKRQAEQIEEDKRKELEKEKQEAKEAGVRQKAKLAALSARELRAIAAENRMAALRGEKCCDCCGKPLTHLVPFERLKYRYCSVECVQKHIRELKEQGK